MDHSLFFVAIVVLGLVGGLSLCVILALIILMQKMVDCVSESYCRPTTTEEAEG